MRSKARCLLDKAVDAMVAAIEVYNKPIFAHREETFSILADVSFGVGAIAAGLGVVLLLTSGDSAESRPAAGATARLRLGPSGVLVDGRF